MLCVEVGCGFWLVVLLVVVFLRDGFVVSEVMDCGVLLVFLMLLCIWCVFVFCVVFCFFLFFGDDGSGVGWCIGYVLFV